MPPVRLIGRCNDRRCCYMMHDVLAAVVHSSVAHVATCSDVPSYVVRLVPVDACLAVELIYDQQLSSLIEIGWVSYRLPASHT
jgi:hypothetical protein